MLIWLVQQICNPTSVRSDVWTRTPNCHQSLKNQLSDEQNSFGENYLF